MPLRSHFYLLTALVIVVLVALAAWLSSGSRPHYPVVRTATPDGVTLTFIGLPWNDGHRCEEARKRVVTLLRTQCQSCRLDLAECWQQLEPSWEKIFRGEAATMFVVHTDTQYIVIDADRKTAQEICTGMAAQIEKQGRQHALCIGPLS